MEADPDLELTVDVERLVVSAPALGVDAPFPLDAATQERFLGGLDDIGITLRSAEHIDRFEADPPRVQAVGRRPLSTFAGDWRGGCLSRHPGGKAGSDLGRTDAVPPGPGPDGGGERRAEGRDHGIERHGRPDERLGEQEQMDDRDRPLGRRGQPPARAAAARRRR